MVVALLKKPMIAYCVAPLCKGLAHVAHSYNMFNQVINPSNLDQVHAGALCIQV